MGWGGVVPFLPIIIRLLTLACRCLHCLCISGAALDDAEHSLTDLDFRDQLARRLFSVLRPLCTTSFSFAVRPVAGLVLILIRSSVQMFNLKPVFFCWGCLVA